MNKDHAERKDPQTNAQNFKVEALDEFLYPVAKPRPGLKITRNGEATTIKAGTVKFLVQTAAFEKLCRDFLGK